jgi:nucleotide-binding universal stress UspA family protein
MPFQRILIAVDDTVESMKAARSGFELGHQLNASMAILYVVDKGKEVVNPDLGITPGESQTVLLEEAERTLSQYVQLYNGGQEIPRFTPEGHPDKEIVSLAREWKADLIVMGTHGRSGIGRMLNGSVAEQVIRHAGVPVLIAPPQME